MFQLMAQKDGVIKYCTNYMSFEGREIEAYLEWKSVNDENCYPCYFESEKQAWWFWYKARETRPDEYKGWWGEVVEVLR